MRVNLNSGYWSQQIDTSVLAQFRRTHPCAREDAIVQVMSLWDRFKDYFLANGNHYQALCCLFDLAQIESACVKAPPDSVTYDRILCRVAELSQNLNHLLDDPFEADVSCHMTERGVRVTIGLYSCEKNFHDGGQLAQLFSMVMPVATDKRMAWHKMLSSNLLNLRPMSLATRFVHLVHMRRFIDADTPIATEWAFDDWRQSVLPGELQFSNFPRQQPAGRGAVSLYTVYKIEECVVASVPIGEPWTDVAQQDDGSSPIPALLTVDDEGYDSDVSGLMADHVGEKNWSSPSSATTPTELAERAARLFPETVPEG